MPRVGDACTRPTSNDLELELSRCESNGATIILLAGGTKDTVPTSKISDALCYEFGIINTDLAVMKHHPEDYFVYFSHKHHQELAANRGAFKYEGLNIQVRRWRMRTYSEHAEQRYHVRLCLEGIPIHAWTQQVVNKVVSKMCSVHYIEENSLNHSDTRSLNLWAWVNDPSKIAKVDKLTFNLPLAVTPNPAMGRVGLMFRVLIHLDLLEDYSGASHEPGAPTIRPRTRLFTWYPRRVDGEEAWYDRDARQQPHHDRRRDDGDDDQHRRDRRNDRSDRNARSGGWRRGLSYHSTSVSRGFVRERTWSPHHRDNGRRRPVAGKWGACSNGDSEAPKDGDGDSAGALLSVHSKLQKEVIDGDSKSVTQEPSANVSYIFAPAEKLADTQTSSAEGHQEASELQVEVPLSQEMLSDPHVADEDATGEQHTAESDGPNNVLNNTNDKDLVSPADTTPTLAHASKQKASSATPQATQEGKSEQEMLQFYINLFKGPLSDMMINIIALCGLDKDAIGNPLEEIPQDNTIENGGEDLGAAAREAAAQIEAA
ncbi:hypothetical protein ACP4OV_007510 [Aristida adscensionis]